MSSSVEQKGRLWATVGSKPPKTFVDEIPVDKDLTRVPPTQVGSGSQPGTLWQADAVLVGSLASHHQIPPAKPSILTLALPCPPPGVCDHLLHHAHPKAQPRGSMWNLRTYYKPQLSGVSLLSPSGGISPSNCSAPLGLTPLPSLLPSFPLKPYLCFSTQHSHSLVQLGLTQKPWEPLPCKPAHSSIAYASCGK